MQAEIDPPVKSSNRIEGWEVVPVGFGWLWRLLALRSPEGDDIDVVYNGWGLGHEDVFVNGIRAVRKWHSGAFAPRIEFQIPRHTAAINVQVSPWIGMILQLELEVDGQVIYREPSETGKAEA